MKQAGYQICGRCVMDTSDPDITFDRQGYCNHCTEFLNVRAGHLRRETNNRQLQQLFELVRRSGKGRQYDCIIGMSGGVDSSYLAYLTVEHGLRPLAVHMDNGWDCENAVVNLRLMTDALKLDYQSYVLDWEEFKVIQLAFLRASVPEAETPTDLAIPVALHHFATRLGIRYILSAGNLATEGILPKSWHYNARDLKYFKHIVRKFTGISPRSFKNFGMRREMWFKFARGIKTLYPVNLVEFDQSQIVSFLSDSFGYRYCGQKHFESRYTKFIQSYYLFQKFGIDYRRATFSSQIASGDLDREQAIEMLTTKPYDEDWVNDEIPYIAKKLDISIRELQDIIAAPPKWYWDYPNNEVRLAYVYNAYRRLFRKDKLASV